MTFARRSDFQAPVPRPRAPVESTTRLLDTPPAASRFPPTATAFTTGPDPQIVATPQHTEPGGRHGAPLVVLSLTGDVDMDTTGPLWQTLSRAVTTHRRVCCDLSSVGFFGAAGVNVLLAAYRLAQSTGCRFGVRGVHGLTRQVLRITGADAVLPVWP